MNVDACVKEFLFAMGIAVLGMLTLISALYLMKEK